MANNSKSSYVKYVQYINDIQYNYLPVLYKTRRGAGAQAYT